MEKLSRHILCIDLKSFFASVECIERKLDPFCTPLVVANIRQGNGAITLAVSPYLKQKGIYPSYHMNKNNWVSIILDDTLNDEDIMNLIQISFDVINDEKNIRK